METCANDSGLSAPTPDRSFKSTDPVFIVGSPRSGTTLLAAMFDRHSQIATTPETFCFRHFWSFVLGGRERCEAAKLIKLFTQGRYTRELQLDPAVLCGLVGTGEISVMEFIRTAISLFAHQQGKSHCAEKTPVHLFFVPQIIKYFPDSRIICIYRDGRDCVLSRRKLEHAVPAMRGFAARWRESSIAMLSFRRAYPDRFHTVQYEALLTDPVGQLTSLMNFVGLDFEPWQLDPTRKTGVTVDWDLSYKKKIYSDIDPSRAYAWKKTASPRDVRIMNSMMRPYLGQLGYEPGDENRGNLLVRGYDASMNVFFRILYDSRLAEWRRLARYVLKPVLGSSPHIMPLAPISKPEQPPRLKSAD